MAEDKELGNRVEIELLPMSLEEAYGSVAPYEDEPHTADRHRLTGECDAELD